MAPASPRWPTSASPAAKGRARSTGKVGLVGTYPEESLLGALRAEIERVILEQYPDYQHEVSDANEFAATP